MSLVSPAELERFLIELRQERIDHLHTLNILEDYLAETGIEHLSEKEHQILDFLIRTIEYFRIQKTDRFPTLEELIEESEANWEVYTDWNEKEYSKYLDKCFRETPEEELLALVEDSLVDLPKEVFIVIWIMCKTLIDVIFNPQSKVEEED